MQSSGLDLNPRALPADGLIENENEIDIGHIPPEQAGAPSAAAGENEIEGFELLSMQLPDHVSCDAAHPCPELCRLEMKASGS
jgi:hypothetical protein